MKPNEDDFLENIKKYWGYISAFMAILGVVTLYVSVNELFTSTTQLSKKSNTFYDSLKETDKDFYYQVFGDQITNSFALDDEVKDIIIENRRDISKIMNMSAQAQKVSFEYLGIVTTNTKSNFLNFFISQENKKIKKEINQKYSLIYNNEVIDEINLSMNNNSSGVLSVLYNGEKILLDEFNYIFSDNEDVVTYRNSTEELIPVGKGKTKLYLFHKNKVLSIEVKVTK